MPSARRLVRRRPLFERIQAYLNPLDFLLWLSEELETTDWEQWQQAWALPLGLGLNVLMLIGRANTSSRSSAYDDVFGDASPSAGFLSWLATIVTHTLSILAFVNAIYTFWRKRHYRLFESSVDQELSTPSARRVKVQSDLVTSSPLRFLSSMIADNSAESRAHPDQQKDVWEVSIWDPLPVCLQIFCFFSPGHVLIYWLFLPTSPLDSRPSTTVATTLALAALLSAQLHVLQSNFKQQSKDTLLIHKEVLHEYDTKFVHPRTQHRMRDVGTQCTSGTDAECDVVEVFTPTTIVSPGGFRTRPNPNYRAHIDPNGESIHETPRHVTTGRSPSWSVQSPLQAVRDAVGSPAQHTVLRRPQYRASTGGSGAAGGDGGSLGIYSHSQSPLKKSASTSFAPNARLQRLQGSPARRESGRF